MYYTLQVNGKSYPLHIAPVEYNIGYWMTAFSVVIPAEVSARIDADNPGHFPNMIANMVEYALIDGWTTQGNMEGDDDFPAVVWSVHDASGEIPSRDALADALNPESCEG
jgi:hypothetical protein